MSIRWNFYLNWALVAISLGLLFIQNPDSTTGYLYPDYAIAIAAIVMTVLTLLGMRSMASNMILSFICFVVFALLALEVYWFIRYLFKSDSFQIEFVFKMIAVFPALLLLDTPFLEAQKFARFKKQ